VADFLYKMDNNTGSFGSAIGGTDALKQAMASRGVDASVLQQLTPAAPNYMEMPQAPQGMPQGMSIPQGSMGMPQETGAQPEGQIKPPTPESELIIKALSKRLEQLGQLGQ
jgi:hypothetical protein